ncbi:MAG: GAF domain-containing protein [Anaerolineae bacterium]|jgi:PAS domain S-box-containing protein
MKWLRGLPHRKDRASLEERLALVDRIGRELNVGLDLMGIVRRALGLAVQAVEANRGSLIVLDEQDRAAVAARLRGSKFRQMDMDHARQALEVGLEGWVASHREPVLLADASDDPRWIPFPSDRRRGAVAAAVCVPLCIPRRVVGVLTCTHPKVDYFDQLDIDTLSLVANQAAVALENARLFAGEEQRRHLADTLSEIARTLTATLDLDEVLNLILKHLERVVPYDSASIFLRHEDRFVIRAWRGLPDSEIVRNLSFSILGEQIMARAAASREPIVCDDVQQEEGWENIPELPHTRGWIAAPLAARDEVTGALTVDSHQVGAYTEEDARVVAAFADHAAVAVANARLWQQIQRRLDEVAFLHQTGRLLTASLDLEEILHALMISVRDHFQVEATSVALKDEQSGDMIFRIAVGAVAEDVVGMRIKVGQGIGGWVAKSGEPIIVPVARQDPRFYSGVDAVTGFHTGAVMAVPIRLGDEVIGVVEAMNPLQGHLDQEDLRLLLNVGTLAASAIQNARHFNRARDAEQRYASLFENSADAIVITDTEGCITDVNRKLCQMLDYGREELLGREFFFLHRDPDGARDRLLRAQEGDSFFYSVETLTRDGRRIPFEVRATDVSHGARPYIQWIYHDVSERLELERVREQLTHMIIHDLRNPLSSIMSSLELIGASVLGGVESIPLDQVFAVAQRSGRRLYLLIDSLLDLARLEAGQGSLARQIVDVEQMTSEVVDQIRPVATAHELEFERQVPDTLPSLWGDRDLLQRVLLNLLDNAIKFTPPGGMIQLSVEPAESNALQFAVSDTGVGIDPEYHEQIFDRFSRATGSEIQGTGLGLALCKLAVEAHGGRIWVESVVDEGATFKFVLPIDGIAEHEEE